MRSPSSWVQDCWRCPGWRINKRGCGDLCLDFGSGYCHSAACHIRAAGRAMAGRGRHCGIFAECIFAPLGRGDGSFADRHFRSGYSRHRLGRRTILRGVIRRRRVCVRFFAVVRRRRRQLARRKSFRRSAKIFGAGIVRRFVCGSGGGVDIRRQNPR